MSGTAMELVCAFLGIVLGLLLAKWHRAARARALVGEKPKLVAEKNEARLRLTGHMHPEVNQQCFDVAGSAGTHHDLLIVNVDGWTALFLDVTKDGDIRIFSDHTMRLEHEAHLSNVHLSIRTGRS